MMPDSPTPPTFRRRWAEDAAPEAAPRRPTRALRLFLALALFQLLAGVIAGMLYWLRPFDEPYFVPLWITEYESRQLPANAGADADRQVLLQSGLFPHRSGTAYSSQERHLLLQELAGLRNRPRGEPVVLYLSALASTGEGGVLLLPGDILLDDPHTWLPLRDVLQYLKECPARHKLLILDVMRPVADPRLAMLANDTASAVHADLQAVPDPHRLVLCACAPGQVSMNAEELGRSIFGYYLEEGLRGWADGCIPGGRSNGRVMARELAEFVRGRVDRWSLQCRGVRQTPLLVGDGADFALAPLLHDQPQPHPPLPALPVYPEWLLEGWRLRDQWLADSGGPYAFGPLTIAPRVVRQLEANLLKAERDWRGGRTPDRVRGDLQVQTDTLRSQLAQFQADVPRPAVPRSLAQAAALGQRPHAELAVALAQLVDRVGDLHRNLKPDEADKAQAKLQQEFLEKWKGRPPFELAHAVFEQVFLDTSARPEMIRFLDGLLSAQQPQPEYVETAFLHQLAIVSQAGPGRTPPPLPLVFRAAELVRKGERAASQPSGFPWLQARLEHAAQARHEAEVLFFARGFAALDDADAALRKAIELYDELLVQQEVLLKARQLLDDALLFLPEHVAYLNFDSAAGATWQAAVRETQELLPLLDPGQTPTPAELPARLREIQGSVEALARMLDDLRRPFASDNVARLLALSEQPKATGLVYQELQSLLGIPRLRAEERAAVWRAGIALARRLSEATLQQDNADEQNERALTITGDLASDQSRRERFVRDAAVRRGQESIALLRLAGLPAERIRGLEQAKASVVLAASLRKAWFEELPALVLSPAPPAERDRLSRLLSPFIRVPDLGEASTNPTVQVRRADASALWGWLTDRYRYESRDGVAPHFYDEAAREYQLLTRTAAAAYVEAIPEAKLPSLTPASPIAHVPVTLRLLGGAADSVASLRVFTADSDWLEVTPQLGPEAVPQADGTFSFPLRPAQAMVVPLRIRLKPDSEGSSVPPPLGVLVQVRVLGRTYHARAPVSLASALERLELHANRNLDDPPVPPGDLRLRPIQAKQPLYLFVRNATDKPRNVIAELRDGDASIKGGEAKLTVGPRETKPVLFTPGPPAPGAPGAAPAPTPAELPELRGPLVIRLLDADNRSQLLDLEQVRVEIADPRDYVRVTAIGFTPADPAKNRKNRLDVTVQAIRPLDGPPCHVDLVLPAEAIPCVRGVRAGNFRGQLPADPAAPGLTLYAEDIQLATGADEDGFVYLTVDGVPRAFRFRTTFARSGAPTSPREDNTPAIGLQAARAVRAGPNYPVTVNLDSPPGDASLEVSLGRTENGEWRPDLVERRPTSRRRHVGFAPGPDGALLFECSLGDWTIPLDVSRIVGRRELVARLLDASGNEIRRATQTIVIDDSEPEGVAFVAPPKQAPRDKAVTLEARGRDPESGIAEVHFFVGKPVDGKLPPNTPTVKAGPSANGGSWIASLPVPPERKGPTEFSVQVINGVGQSAFATTTIEVVEGDPEKTGPGRIRGLVTEADRPQPGLEVALHDDKNAVKAKTVTKADGTFEFPDVPPGKYKVTTAKPATRRKAEAAVTLEGGKTVEIKLDLLR